MARAAAEEFDELHGNLTRLLNKWVEKGDECTVAEARAAIDWLAKNHITGVAIGNSPLAKLLASLEVSDEEVERAIR